MRQAAPPGTAPPDPQLLTTYRYLRMALVTVLVLLFAGVLLQVAVSARPPLPSISDYYWTPVRSVFVGSLVALGVGMVVLKADNELEDIVLNIGGVLAPVVAFVPAPQLGTCVVAPGSGPRPALPQDTVDAITNNVSALLVAGAVGLIIFAALAYGVRDLDPDRRRLPRNIRVARAVGTGVVVAVFVGGWLWFRAGRAGFECHAHAAAAITLFVCIIVVTALNAVTRTLDGLAAGRPLPRAALNQYSAIALLMAVVLAVGLLTYPAWLHAILFVESGVLLLFLAFWVVQSRELWATGVRHRLRERSLVPRASLQPGQHGGEGG
jgi:hypothetical protein